MKTTVEEDLLEIKHAKIHILMLNEKNAELCKVNDDEIARLAKVIENRETSAHEKLTESGEKKIDTPAGYVSFRAMPDKWVYEEGKVIKWLDTFVSPIIANSFMTIKTSLKWNDFKKRLIEDSPYAFEDGRINKKIITDELTLTNDTGGILVEGISVKQQDPKFTYKLKGDLL